MIEKTYETGILSTLDQEKAFDHVDHDFLMRTLAKFGFGPIFCQWVSLFYDNVFLILFVMENCPHLFSSVGGWLYVLVSEVLSTQIRNCLEIIGFRLPSAGGLHFKISQYANDAANFVKSERSLFHLLCIVIIYKQGSGAKLNTSKSEAMWLGGWQDIGERDWDRPSSKVVVFSFTLL